MSISPTHPKEKVAHLAERFARNLDAYKSADYKEARVRVEFVDPLFEALGWDVGPEKPAAAAIPADKELYQRQIEATDRQIDALVYELYGLTEEESALVKGYH